MASQAQTKRLKTQISLLTDEKGFLPKVSRAGTAPLPCENHARKMRTFFTRRLEPKTKSSHVFKRSLRPNASETFSQTSFS